MTLTTIKKAGLDEIALDHVFTIGASGSSAYTFQGEGLNGTVNNPTLYLTRGKTYRFENGSGGHPIRIQSTSGANGTAYNTGVTNNAQAGTVIVEVQHDAPDILYYQCTSHAAMNGILYIVGAVSDGSITANKLASDSVITAKIADDAVTDAKLADDASNDANRAVNTNHIKDLAVETRCINNGAVTAQKLGSMAVTAAAMANDAVADYALSDHVSDDSLRAVGTNHIKTDAVTADKLAHTGVTAATYGTAALIPAITVDAQGRITAATTNSIAVGGTNGVIYNDSVKARFGTAGDLEIFHDSNHSYIKDAGDGNLRVQTNNLRIENAAGTENQALFTEDGSVELYHDNSKKFETTSAGVGVTGAITSTGTISDSKGQVRNVPQVTATSNLVVVSSHAGKHLLHNGTGGWTINTSTGFAVGDLVTFINNTGSAQSIFQAGGVTLYDAADGGTGDHSVAARGMVTAINVATNVFYLSGSIE